MAIPDFLLNFMFFLLKVKLPYLLSLVCVRAKHRLRLLGVKRLDMQDSFAVLQFAHPERLDVPRLLEMLKVKPRIFRLSPEQTLRIQLPKSGTPIERLQNCLKELQSFVKPEQEG